MREEGFLDYGFGRYKLIGRAGRDNYSLHAGEWVDVWNGTRWMAVQVLADEWGRWYFLDADGSCVPVQVGMCARLRGSCRAMRRPGGGRWSIAIVERQWRFRLMGRIVLVVMKQLLVGLWMNMANCSLTLQKSGGGAMSAMHGIVGNSVYKREISLISPRTASNESQKGLFDYDSGRYKLIGSTGRDDYFLHAGEWLEMWNG